jgi:hypothetical protein
MNINAVSTSVPSANVDRLLDERVAQAGAAMEDKFLNMDPVGDAGAWDQVLELEMKVSAASFARDQNFSIQHHLAKTILSAT